MNTKVNNERPGSTFKLPSTEFHTITSTLRTNLPIRMNKQCKAQGSTKPLQRTSCIESMDSDTDCIVANLNLDEILNNYNTWKLKSSLSFLNANLLHIIHLYSNVCKQMIGVRSLQLHKQFSKPFNSVQTND